VYTLAVYKNGYQVGSKDVFYNGTLYDQVDERNAAVSSPAGQSPTVEANKINCTYVLEQNGPQTVRYTGKHANVGQTHSVVGWPK
jgi:hypothetical protein